MGGHLAPILDDLCVRGGRCLSFGVEEGERMVVGRLGGEGFVGLVGLECQKLLKQF